MQALPSLWNGAIAGNWYLLALASDAAVPPLILLGFLALGTTMICSLIGVISGTFAPLSVCLATLIFFGAGLLLAWLRCGRDVLPARTLLSTIPYVVSKLPTYAGMLFSSGRTTNWVRTERRKQD
jgi:hypothetical protein